MIGSSFLRQGQDLACDEMVTGERHEAVGLVIWVNLVSSAVIIDVMFSDVIFRKEDARLLSKLAMMACFSAEV